MLRAASEKEGLSRPGPGSLSALARSGVCGALYACPKVLELGALQWEEHITEVVLAG